MKKTHSRKWYVLAGLGMFALSTASICVYILTPRKSPFAVENADELFDILQDGDIICRLGDRLWSDIFSGLSETDKRYSHLGIIRLNNGVVTVINAEGNTGHGRDFVSEVSEVSIDDFLKVARRVGIYRMNDIDAGLISQTALEYMGIPFDWQFDMTDESKLYCTELLYVILKRLQPSLALDTVFIKELGKEIVPLEAISNSEHFTEVYTSVRHKN